MKRILSKFTLRPTFLTLLLLLLFLLATAGIYLAYRANLELHYLVAVLWILTVLVLLYLGNTYIYNYLSRKWPWEKQTTKRFFLQLLLSTLYSLACVNGTYYMLKVQLTGLAPDLEQVIVMNVYGLLFIVPLLLLNFGIFFMMRWKKAFTHSEKLREENLRSQLESLRMHLDPHFLFNNLNILSAQIQKDPKDAQLFLDKFADVYRYVLQHKNEELVALTTELTFIESYIYLLKKRFENQLQITIHIADLPAGGSVPPLSLQLLVENAIKHNKISANSPLVISISLEEEKWLVVTNNCQPKASEPVTMTKTGLDNIRKRYEYLSDLTIEVTHTDAFFKVKLPLLEILD